MENIYLEEIKTLNLLSKYQSRMVRELNKKFIIKLKFNFSVFFASDIKLLYHLFLVRCHSHNSQLRVMHIDSCNSNVTEKEEFL